MVRSFSAFSLAEEGGHHQAEEPCHGKDRDEEGVVSEKWGQGAEEPQIERDPRQCCQGNGEGTDGGSPQTVGIFHRKGFAPENCL